ncbi:hypothetical protein ACFE04_024882 [Oxalis oulophora]
MANLSASMFTIFVLFFSLTVIATKDYDYTSGYSRDTKPKTVDINPFLGDSGLDKFKHSAGHQDHAEETYKSEEKVKQIGDYSSKSTQYEDNQYVENQKSEEKVKQIGSNEHYKKVDEYAKHIDSNEHYKKEEENVKQVGPNEHYQKVEEKAKQLGSNEYYKEVKEHAKHMGSNEHYKKEEENVKQVNSKFVDEDHKYESEHKHKIDLIDHVKDKMPQECKKKPNNKRPFFYHEKSIKSENSHKSTSSEYSGDEKSITNGY